GLCSPDQCDDNCHAGLSWDSSHSPPYVGDLQLAPPSNGFLQFGLWSLYTCLSGPGCSQVGTPQPSSMFEWSTDGRPSWDFPVATQIIQPPVKLAVSGVLGPIVLVTVNGSYNHTAVGGGTTHTDSVTYTAELGGNGQTFVKPAAEAEAVRHFLLVLGDCNSPIYRYLLGPALLFIHLNCPGQALAAYDAALAAMDPPDPNYGQ